MQHHRRTKSTIDPDANNLNAKLNPVAHAIAIGAELEGILQRRFGGNLTMFRAWVRQHIDKDILTCCRYLVLHRRRDYLQAQGYVRLVDAYRSLNIAAGTFDIAGTEISAN